MMDRRPRKPRKARYRRQELVQCARYFGSPKLIVKPIPLNFWPSFEIQSKSISGLWPLAGQLGWVQHRSEGKIQSFKHRRAPASHPYALSRPS